MEIENMTITSVCWTHKARVRSFFFFSDKSTFSHGRLFFLFFWAELSKNQTFTMAYTGDIVISVQVQVNLREDFANLIDTGNITGADPGCAKGL